MAEVLGLVSNVVAIVDEALKIAHALNRVSSYSKKNAATVSELVRQHIQVREVLQARLRRGYELDDTVRETSDELDALFVKMEDLSSPRKRFRWTIVLGAKHHDSELERFNELQADLDRKRNWLRREILVKDRNHQSWATESQTASEDMSDDDFEHAQKPWKQNLAYTTIDSRLSNSYLPPQRGPWKAVRILSLEDGPFDHGLTALHVLEKLMDHVEYLERYEYKPPADSSAWSPLYWTQQPEYDESRKQENFKPCHYFDYVCGTGTGGMSASMLGVMRLSVPEAIDRMVAVQKMLQLSNTLSAMKRLQPRAKAEILQLEKALHKHLSGENGGYYLQADDEDMCQTICITAMRNRRGAAMPCVHKSFKEPMSTPDTRWSSHPAKDPRGMPIIDVCMASVGPELCSTSVKVGGTTYKDAAILDINSAWRAYEEATNRRREESGDIEDQSIDYLLSFRCTKDRSTPEDRSKEKSADSPDHLEATFQARYNRVLERKFADAFHVFDITRTSGTPKVEADEYCEKHDAELRQWANKLVKARRARCQTREWSRFAGLQIKRDPIVKFPVRYGTDSTSDSARSNTTNMS